MSDEPVTKAELLRQIQQGWDAFHAFLAHYSPDQLATLKDAVGWTPKDHIVHLAMWEAGVRTLLDGQSQREGMDLDEATWASGEDNINAALKQRYEALTLDEVLDLFRRGHAQLVAKIEALSDDDLQQRVIGSIIGNTYGHYEEHTPWIAAIVDSK